MAPGNQGVGRNRGSIVACHAAFPLMAIPHYRGWPILPPDTHASIFNTLLEFLDKHKRILLVEPAGVGKGFLAQALGCSAIRLVSYCHLRASQRRQFPDPHSCGITLDFLTIPLGPRKTD